MDYHGLSWTIMDYHGLSWTIMDYHRLSWTVMDCHGLSWTDIDCHGLSWTILGILHIVERLVLVKSLKTEDARLRMAEIRANMNEA